MSWRLNKDGGSDIRSIYNALWRSCAVTFTLKSIWGVKAPRRVSFFVWLAAWGKILTGDHLRRRHFTIVD